MFIQKILFQYLIVISSLAFYYYLICQLTYLFSLIFNDYGQEWYLFIGVPQKFIVSQCMIILNSNYFFLKHVTIMI